LKGVNAVDFDDEILRFNGGVWPDIETKNEVVRPKAMNHVLSLSEVILFHSYMSSDDLYRLRDTGFRVVLIEVSEAELRRRDAQRQVEEGWTNIEWFDWNQAAIAEVRASGLVDAVISGERDVAAIASDILRLGVELSNDVQSAAGEN
jgi:hypothetical protein